MQTKDEYPQSKKEYFHNPLTTQGLEILCHRLCKEPKIRFCGVINSLGRIVTGGFRDSVEPLDNEDQRRMLYIQSTLEISMKREFNDTLGNVNFIVTYRDNVALISIPIQQNFLLLMSVERNAEIEQIVKKTTSIFESNGMLGKKTKSTTKDNSTLFSECT